MMFGFSVVNQARLSPPRKIWSPCRPMLGTPASGDHPGRPGAQCQDAEVVVVFIGVGAVVAVGLALPEEEPLLFTGIEALARIVGVGDAGADHHRIVVLLL